MTRFKLEVNKTYQTRTCRHVRIVMKTDIFDKGHDMFRPFLGDNGVRYTEDGNANWMSTRGQTLDDLICELPEKGASVEETVGTLVMGITRQLFGRAV